MAFRYQVLETHVELTLEGALTREDIAGIQAAARTDPEFKPSLPLLIDGRGLEALEDVGPAEVRALASNRSEDNRQGGLRVFVLREPVYFGLTRMFQGLADDRGQMHVLDDYDAALAMVRGD